MEGPCLDIMVMETERHARLEKGKRLLDTFVSSLVIDVSLCNKQEDIGFFCPEIFDLDPVQSRGRLVATKLFVQLRWEWLCEEVGFKIGFGSKRMETYVDMAGAFIEFALHWSIVERAECAGLDETIDLSSFRLGPFFWRQSGMTDPHLLLD